MARRFSLLPLLLVATLAGCETMPYDSGYYEPGVPERANYRSGLGVVEAVEVVDAAAAGVVVAPVRGAVVGTIVGSPAAAGAPVATVAAVPPGAYVERRAYVEAYRLTLRMDDGTVQSIVQDNRLFRVGDRVQVTPEGRVIQV